MLKFEIDLFGPRVATAPGRRAPIPAPPDIAEQIRALAYELPEDAALEMASGYRCRFCGCQARDPRAHLHHAEHPACGRLLAAYRASFAPDPAACPAPFQVALIACSGPKLDHPAPARALYTSALFRKSLRVAEEVLRSDLCLVLSGLHHVVPVERSLAPYERDVTRLRAHEYGAWAFHLAQALERLLGRLPVRFTCFAAALYLDPLEAHARRKPSLAWSFAEPLAGLAIGERLRWLNGQLADVTRRRGTVDGTSVVIDARDPEGGIRACEACGNTAEDVYPGDQGALAAGRAQALAEDQRLILAHDAACPRCRGRRTFCRHHR